MAVDLCVKIGEDATLEKWIFGEVDATNYVSGLELIHLSESEG